MEALPSLRRGNSDEAVVTVDVHAAKGLLSAGHLYLDVRTTEEYQKGHLENSLNVPYMLLTPRGKVKNPLFLEKVTSLCKKDDSIVVGCQAGGRSFNAAADLSKAGFQNVKNVGGGYVALVQNGYDVKKFEEQLR